MHKPGLARAGAEPGAPPGRGERRACVPAVAVGDDGRLAVSRSPWRVVRFGRCWIVLGQSWLVRVMPLVSLSSRV
jgi:hypothetical protein